MMKKFGIPLGFNSKKGKPVPGADVSGVRAIMKRQPRATIWYEKVSWWSITDKGAIMGKWRESDCGGELPLEVVLLTGGSMNVQGSWYTQEDGSVARLRKMMHGFLLQVPPIIGNGAGASKMVEGNRVTTKGRSLDAGAVVTFLGQAVTLEKKGWTKADDKIIERLSQVRNPVRVSSHVGNGDPTEISLLASSDAEVVRVAQKSLETLTMPKMMINEACMPIVGLLAGSGCGTGRIAREQENPTARSHPAETVPSMEGARVNLGRLLEFPFEETRSIGGGVGVPVGFANSSLMSMLSHVAVGCDLGVIACAEL
ncbi:hypothetical protein NE237_031671 [Protea cynaroides]|uniref:Uncharacterized protein n=1 Tax=Protea cynaroides TaxID=273540 RepID=A0A9Q0R2N7_9MAGN|nr:hypothetical protein NE237_031671 [Protea cynaroides]